MSVFNRRLRAHLRAELKHAAHHESRGELSLAFRRLERAHVLSQASTVDHLRVHARMFLWALRRHKVGEAYGQAWRFVAALVMTPLGLLPYGNTGGADVSGFESMPVPPDLRRLMEEARR